MAKRFAVETIAGSADACVVSTFSSRVCERGTKGCDVRHDTGPEVERG